MRRETDAEFEARWDKRVKRVNRDVLIAKVLLGLSLVMVLVAVGNVVFVLFWR